MPRTVQQHYRRSLLLPLVLLPTAACLIGLALALGWRLGGPRPERLEALVQSAASLAVRGLFTFACISPLVLIGWWLLPRLSARGARRFCWAVPVLAVIPFNVYYARSADFPGWPTDAAGWLDYGRFVLATLGVCLREGIPWVLAAEALRWWGERRGTITPAEAAPSPHPTAGAATDATIPAPEA